MRFLYNLYTTGCICVLFCVLQQKLALKKLHWGLCDRGLCRIAQSTCWMSKHVQTALLCRCNSAFFHVEKCCACVCVFLTVCMRRKLYIYNTFRVGTFDGCVGYNPGPTHKPNVSPKCPTQNPVQCIHHVTDPRDPVTNTKVGLMTKGDIATPNSLGNCRTCCGPYQLALLSPTNTLGFHHRLTWLVRSLPKLRASDEGGGWPRPFAPT